MGEAEVFAHTRVFGGTSGSRASALVTQLRPGSNHAAGNLVRKYACIDSEEAALNFQYLRRTPRKYSASFPSFARSRPVASSGSSRGRDERFRGGWLVPPGASNGAVDHIGASLTQRYAISSIPRCRGSASGRACRGVLFQA